MTSLRESARHRRPRIHISAGLVERPCENVVAVYIAPDSPLFPSPHQHLMDVLPPVEPEEAPGPMDAPRPLQGENGYCTSKLTSHAGITLCHIRIAQQAEHGRVWPNGH